MPRKSHKRKPSKSRSRSKTRSSRGGGIIDTLTNMFTSKPVSLTSMFSNSDSSSPASSSSSESAAPQKSSFFSLPKFKWPFSKLPEAPDVSSLPPVKIPGRPSSQQPVQQEGQQPAQQQPPAPQPAQLDKEEELQKTPQDSSSQSSEMVPPPRTRPPAQVPVPGIMGPNTGGRRNKKKSRKNRK